MDIEIKTGIMLLLNIGGKYLPHHHLNNTRRYPTIFTTYFISLSEEITCKNLSILSSICNN